ncbi:MAG TPA: ABC transporter substrate-binding protein [Dongiaceae bacterium]|nr:ABC transporter substrate-binding protein [Dongiaceae bacterium]
MKIGLQRLAVLATLGLALALGGHAQALTRGGKMVYARNADSLFLDPVLNERNVDIWILTNLYDTLLEPTTDGRSVQPGLAESYQLSDDGLTFTARLRANLKFADGSPLTVDDVKWSLDRARDPKNGAWNFTLESIDSIETKGADTVVLHLKHPDPALTAALAIFNCSVMSKKLFEAAPGATDADKAKAFAEHPIGSGPFMLDSWQRGTQMVIKRNPYYWQMGEDGKPLPYLDEVDFQIISDDATRILKLQAGEVDGAEFIPYARVAELKGDPNLNMELFPSTKVTYLTLNIRPKLKNGTPNPLSDERVRQALNFAIDKDAVIKLVTFGVGTPMRSYMSSSTPLFYGPGPAYAYDLAKAKALMKDAGQENGFALDAQALAGSADDAANLSTIQQMWAQLGVKLNITQMDNATMVSHYDAADFQIQTGYWTDDIIDPSEITSYFTYFPTTESQHSGYDDPTIQKLYLDSTKEADKAKRAEQYKQIQEIYVKAAPIVFMYQSPYPVGLRKTVQGFVQIQLGNNIFLRTHMEKQ